jgi:hypothetical protein
VLFFHLNGNTWFSPSTRNGSCMFSRSILLFEFIQRLIRRNMLQLNKYRLPHNLYLQKIVPIKQSLLFKARYAPIVLLFNYHLISLALCIKFQGSSLGLLLYSQRSLLLKYRDQVGRKNKSKITILRHSFLQKILCQNLWWQ